MHIARIRMSVIGTPSPSTLNDSVSVDTTKALVFSSKNLDGEKTFANNPEACEVNSIESLGGCVQADD